MKKMNMLMAAAGVMAMLLCGCGGGGGDDGGDNGPSRTPVPTTTVTTTANDAAETVYVTVTGEDGAAVTDAEGAGVTTAIEATSGDPTTTTDDATTTEEAVTTSTATTTKATTTTTTTTAKPTTTKAKTTAATTSKAATTTKPTTTTTTAKAITTTTTAKVANNADPWAWPCDWKGMEADCKAYVESQGWHWDANLNVDNGSWDGKRHSVWNELWEEYDVLEDSIKEDVSFYASQGDTYFKCVFIPDEDYNGHYHIYIVHGSGPTPDSMPEESLNPDYIDLAQKAVN